MAAPAARSIYRLVSILPSGVEANEYTIKPDGPTTIGRQGSDVAFPEDLGLSDIHASIIPAPDGYRVRDEGSAEGVYVRPAEGRQVPVDPGTILRVGRQWLVVGEDPTRPGLSHYDSGGQLIARHDLKQGNTILGRQSPDVTIAPEDGSISRRHLAVVVRRSARRGQGPGERQRDLHQGRQADAADARRPVAPGSAGAAVHRRHPDVVSGIGHRGENEPGTSSRKAGSSCGCARARPRQSAVPGAQASGATGRRQAAPPRRACGAGCCSGPGRSDGRSNGDVRGHEAAGAVPERPDHLRGRRTCRHQARGRLSRRCVRHGPGESDFRWRASRPVELDGAGDARRFVQRRAWAVPTGLHGARERTGRRGYHQAVVGGHRRAAGSGYHLALAL